MLTMLSVTSTTTTTVTTTTEEPTTTSTTPLPTTTTPLPGKIIFPASHLGTSFLIFEVVIVWVNKSI